MKPRKLSRREVFKALVAGGVLTATGLWMPGEKVISIPSGKVFDPQRFVTLLSTGAHSDIMVPVPTEGSTLQEFYSQLCEIMDSFTMMSNPNPLIAQTSNFMYLNDGYRLAQQDLRYLKAGTIWERSTGHYYSEVFNDPAVEGAGLTHHGWVDPERGFLNVPETLIIEDLD